ncbi:MAG: DNA-binding protein WhiA [Clostridia bacterium]|nr:DNA-binding protein WhiA [Clostridia bacterium]
MSFASDVKKELIDMPAEKECCAPMLLAGMLSFGGKFSSDDYYTLTSESYRLMDYLSTLCAERFLICPTLIKKGGNYSLILPEATMLLQELDILKAGQVKFSFPDMQSDCCKRAFIKGAFLSSGTISSPEKQYHLEFSTPHFGISEPLRELLMEFDIPSKTLRRKSRYVTYFKDNDVICDVLALMGAGRAALSLSETNIRKNIANRDNRIINSENANYDKTITASVKQIIAINTIDSHIGLENLPVQLGELARLRLENRDLPLSELAERLEISKSGVNHRMRKILEIAENLTGENENE